MNLYHGLLFLHGYIADPKLATLLADTEHAQQPAKPVTRTPRSNLLRWLFEEMALLGGRPVSRPHYDDLEEPFPPLHGCA